MAQFRNPFSQQGFVGVGPENEIDLAQAGPQAFAPDLARLSANTPYVRRNVVPILIEAPRFFSFTNQAPQLTRALKAYIELHTRTVEGLDQTLTVDVGESPIGGSGEVLQTATNITRARSNPVHGCWELQGRSISRFLQWWIRYGIGDENTKIPLVVSNGGVRERDYDITFAGATVLYIEPDPTFQDVVSAWLCTNMFPTATPQIEGSKDAAQLGQQLDLSVTFTAITDPGQGTMLFAREMLQRANLAGLNPQQAPSYLEGLGADVAAADTGLADTLETAAAQRIAF